MDAVASFDRAMELVKSDPYLRAVIKTARSYGISPRRFLGWEPKVSTRVWANGEQLTISEIEWDEETRLLAMAYAAWEASLCSGCGQSLDECTDADNEGRYRVPVPTRCHACTAREMASEMYSKEAPQPGALLYGVTFVPPPPRTEPDVTGE